MIDIFSLKAEELALKIKDSQLTSVEICEKYIERINKFEKDVKAWAHFDKKLLLEKAVEADEYRRSGKPLGPLHGVPVAVKERAGTITSSLGPIPDAASATESPEVAELIGIAYLTLNFSANSAANKRTFSPPKKFHSEDSFAASAEDIINNSSISGLLDPMYREKFFFRMASKTISSSS